MFVVLLFFLLFFVIIPATLIVLIVWFGISLYNYISARRKNKMMPGTFPDSEMKKRMTTLIVLLVVVCVLVAIEIGFWMLLSMAVAHM